MFTCIAYVVLQYYIDGEYATTLPRHASIGGYERGSGLLRRRRAPG